jgi:AraC-like DNA-binding protein
MNNKVHIKNMVCPRCITTVEEIFKKLNIDTLAIQLGEVSILNEIDESQKIQLKKELVKKGFELLEDNKSKLIGQIKSIVVDQIHHKSEFLNINFSTLLSEKLNHEYTSLSRLFSSVEGITIERFTLKQKIEKVKELLFYNQLTLSEIALQMNYSSSAHLSSQFKKETGMTPSEFKKINKPRHKSLDSL